MPDFLLEIGTEEIPARMIQDAQPGIDRSASRSCWRETRFRIKGSSISIGNSAPAGVNCCAGIPATQPDVQEQLTGPATKVAYKDGQPTPAAHAFAKKAESMFRVAKSDDAERRVSDRVSHEQGQAGRAGSGRSFCPKRSRPFTGLRICTGGRASRSGL